MDHYIYSSTEAVMLGTYFKDYWFRGHSKIYNELTPKIQRKSFFTEPHKIFAENTEFAIIEDFKRKAPSLVNGLPLPSSHLELLIYMQHYGAPTRLLDWTESILIGLFFAVNYDLNEDGELWAIYPHELNSKSDIYGFPLSNEPRLTFCSSEPFHEDIHQLALDLKLKEIPRYPIAFFPTLSFPRITHQLGTFTIHPDSPSITSITNLESPLKDDELIRFIIPGSKKEAIRADLQCLGIENRILFQDLDSLSKDIERKYSNPFWEMKNLKSIKHFYSSLEQSLIFDYRLINRTKVNDSFE